MGGALPSWVTMVRGRYGERPGRGMAVMRERPGRGVAVVRERPGRGVAVVRERPGRRVAVVRERPGRGVAVMRERPGRGVAVMRERPGRGVIVMRECPCWLDERPSVLPVVWGSSRLGDRCRRNMDDNGEQGRKYDTSGDHCE